MTHVIAQATEEDIGRQILLEPKAGKPARGTIVDVEPDGTLIVYVPEVKSVIRGRPRRGLTVEGDGPPPNRSVVPGQADGA